MESNPTTEREALWQQVKAAHDVIDALRAQEEHDQPGHDVHHQMKMATEKLVLAENTLAAFDAENPSVRRAGA